MAKYRLLNDLFGVKAGTICETNEDGFVELKDDDGCVVATLNTRADWFGECFEEVGDEYKRWRDYMVALQTIKDDAKGFVPDWKDSEQGRYAVEYNYDNSTLKVDRWWRPNYGIPVFFATEEDANESIEKHRKEWLIVLGIKEENDED